MRNSHRAAQSRDLDTISDPAKLVRRCTRIQGGVRFPKGINEPRRGCSPRRRKPLGGPFSPVECAKRVDFIPMASSRLRPQVSGTVDDKKARRTRSRRPNADQLDPASAVPPVAKQDHRRPEPSHRVLIASSCNSTIALAVFQAYSPERWCDRAACLCDRTTPPTAGAQLRAQKKPRVPNPTTLSIRYRVGVQQSGQSPQ